MSGIEIAGLVLGALPILFEALDAYKKGASRIKSGFRKREHVKRLARALRMQTQILDALIKSILLQSECEVPVDEEALWIVLQQKSTRATVDDYLGPQNALVFAEALEDCLANLQDATTRIVELVPALKGHPKIQEVLIANENAKKRQMDFVGRFSAIMNLADLDQDVEKLDRCTDTLDRFANRIAANARLAQSAPSRRATKLAKRLRVVHRNAENLHAALVKHWSKPCHTCHEVKLFLDDRVDQGPQKQPLKHAPSSFRVVFSSGPTDQPLLWHETAVQPPDDDHDDDQVTCQVPKIQIKVPPASTSVADRRVIETVCRAIEEAELCRHQSVFHLAREKGMLFSLQKSLDHSSCTRSKSVTLQGILDNTLGLQGPRPWKSRMVLAVKLASSFLQFLRTSWIRPYWTASKVQFLLHHNGRQADMSQPFLSADFARLGQTCARGQSQIKDDLIELGILLLEIWHETTFETTFPAQAGSSTNSYMRHACALQWLDDVQNPLPDLYHKAVSHCLVRVSNVDTRVLEWDDDQLWKAVCENVIDPLSKIAQI